MGSLLATTRSGDENRALSGSSGSKAVMLVRIRGAGWHLYIVLSSCAQEGVWGIMGWPTWSAEQTILPLPLLRPSPSPNIPSLTASMSMPNMKSISPPCLHGMHSDHCPIPQQSPEDWPTEIAVCHGRQKNCMAALAWPWLVGLSSRLTKMQRKFLDGQLEGGRSS